MKYLSFMALSCSLLSTSFLVALNEALIEIQPYTAATAVAIVQEPSTDSIKACIEEISDAKTLEKASSSNATKTSQTESLSWSSWFISWIISPSK